MSSTSQALSTALVLETNNLRGGNATAQDVVAGLQRLFRHLRRQAHSLSRLTELVVTHDGLPRHLQQVVEESAGRSVLFKELPQDADYYLAKNIGFEATTAQIVVFGDSDCWPAERWLGDMIAPFDNPDTVVVAGRTTYREDVRGIAATAIDFIYFPTVLGEHCTRNFYANNVAFRRELFEQHLFPLDKAIYRGPCQVLGFRLHAAKIPIVFAPTARTTHRFPDGLREFVGLRLLRGQDTTELTKSMADHHLPQAARWLGRLGPISPLVVLTGRLCFSLQALGHQDMPRVSGLARLKTISLIAAISALDAMGAIGRGVGVLRPGRGGASSNSVLSYHGDRRPQSSHAVLQRRTAS